MIFILDGKRVNPNQGFIKDGVQYPPGWLEKASQSELTALGFTTRVDAPPPSSEWYISSQKADGTWDAFERDLTVAASNYKQKIKNQARDRILSICPEWKQSNIIARGVEVLLDALKNEKRFPDIPVDVRKEIADGLTLWTQIKAIRSKSDNLESQIDATVNDKQMSYSAKVAQLELLMSSSDLLWA
jgi:hypothetical protein